MPRIKTTRTVTVALLLLRVYLIAMLVLILVKFVLDARGGAAKPPATQSTAAPTETVGWVEQTGDPVGLRSRPSRAPFGHRREALVGNGRRAPPSVRDLDPPCPGSSGQRGHWAATHEVHA